MKYYCVYYWFDNKGKKGAELFAEEEFKNKPKNHYKSLKHKDIFYDWFETLEEAKEFIKTW